MNPFASLFATNEEPKHEITNSDLLKEAMELHRKEVHELKLKGVSSILTSIKGLEGVYVERLKAARAAERLAKTHLEGLKRALAYFGETGNFAPLAAYGVDIRTACKAAGVSYPTPEDQKIPADWKPKSES